MPPLQLASCCGRSVGSINRRGASDNDAKSDVAGVAGPDEHEQRGRDLRSDPAYAVKTEPEHAHARAAGRRR